MILHSIQNRKNKWNSPAPTSSLSGLYSRAVPQVLPVWHHQPGDRDPAPTHPGSSCTFCPSSHCSVPSCLRLPSAALPHFILRHCRSEGKVKFTHYIHIATHVAIHVAIGLLATGVLRATDGLLNIR